MAEYIECRNCDSPNCKGCNIYALATMLNDGKFDPIMNDNHSINRLAYSEVIEVDRSRWKYFRKQGIAVCMNCSFERNLDDNFGRAISCPNCGARMDT